MELITKLVCIKCQCDVTKTPHNKCERGGSHAARCITEERR